MEKKYSVIRQKEQAPLNESFMSTPNLIWFHFALNYLPPTSKPLVFLPCGSANKTRGQNGDSRKFISRGLSHQLMSAITRCEKYSKIILSEPLTIIPYDIEGHSLRPDYNLPPDYLSVQSEFIFIHNLSLYLARLKLIQPERTLIYYLGAMHHYLILHFANKLAGSPFTIVREIPVRGLADYSKGANNLVSIIEECENGKIPIQEPINLSEYLKKRGRYTNLRFWHQILLMQKDQKSIEHICGEDAHLRGFADLYRSLIGVESGLDAFF
jgi:hypothetical protein